MVDGEPKYVSAVCRSDVVDEWRDRRHDGGILIDVTTDEIVAEGLSMPHSPRWHQGRLWVLNSGSDELGWIADGPQGTPQLRSLSHGRGRNRGVTRSGPSSAG